MKATPNVCTYWLTTLLLTGAITCAQLIEKGVDSLRYEKIKRRKSIADCQTINELLSKMLDSTYRRECHLTPIMMAHQLKSKRFAFIGMWLFMPYLLFSQSLEVYPAPQEIAASSFFAVRARINQQPWQSLSVYHSINSLDSLGGLSLGIFSFTGTVELEITPLQQTGPLNQIDVRPKHYGLKPQIDNGKIHLTLTKPNNFVVEVNRDSRQALLISACPIDRKAPQSSDKRVVYFGPGVHSIGEAYPLKSNTTYYLAGGAYLKGAMRGFGTVENVRIYGRGVLNSGHQRYQHPLKGLRSNILFEDGRNVAIATLSTLNWQLIVK